MDTKHLPSDHTDNVSSLGDLTGLTAHQCTMINLGLALYQAIVTNDASQLQIYGALALMQEMGAGPHTDHHADELIGRVNSLLFPTR